MEPTLRAGDRLLVAYGAAVTPGRLVVVRLPGRPGAAVKRATRREPAAGGATGWWVERDSPREGVDSWALGAVPDHDLLGVAVARLWPRPRRLGGSVPQSRHG